ncbi:MAG: hypothetical protein KDB88_13135 [Flavobacteriales bacterium]|nr:hypothetical protein [Flavobacteriales bacterium]
MTFTEQLHDVSAILRHTRSRLLAPLAAEQVQLPRDAELFIEHVLLYVMDEWAEDLRASGHVLEERPSDEGSSYPAYRLQLVGGHTLDLSFTGTYPERLDLQLARVLRDGNSVSNARQASLPLPLTMDAHALLRTLVDGMKDLTI